MYSHLFIHTVIWWCTFPHEAFKQIPFVFWGTWFLMTSATKVWVLTSLFQPWPKRTHMLVLVEWAAHRNWDSIAGKVTAHRISDLQMIVLAHISVQCNILCIIYICIIVHFSYNHMLRYILWQAEFRHILLCFEAVIECVVPSRHWPHPCACPSWATSVHRLTSPIHWAILLWHEWARSPRHRCWRQSKPCGSVRTCEALQDRGSCGALFESEHWLNWLRVDK